jgi:60 kDa SS-A/Ro ribonucleoprotein
MLLFSLLFLTFGYVEKSYFDLRIDRSGFESHCPHYPTGGESIKFNKPIATKPTRTTNYEGGEAYTMDDKATLMTRVACCLMGEPKFYESAGKADEELISLTHKVAHHEPAFVLKLAAYARNEMHLRSVPVALIVEYANAGVSLPDSRRYVGAVCQRADDMTEMIAYQLARNRIHTREAKLPQFIEKGIAEAFPKFSEYQLAKYNRDGMVKLRDVMFLCHPKPRDEKQATTFKRLIDGTLAPPETWEVELSKADGRSRYEKWTAIIPKMGYMATLRNLRNMLEAGVDMEPVWNRLGDSMEVLNSKQMPFRFWSAYNEVSRINTAANPEDIGPTLQVINRALDHSICNVPHLPGTSLIAADVSGSMTGAHISKRSTVTCADVATLFAAMANKICEKSIVGEFDTTWRLVNLNPNAELLENKEKFSKNGGATYGHKIYEWLNGTHKHVDRILLFSDMQLYGGSVRAEHTKYVRDVNPNVHLYSVHLNGYDTAAFPPHTKNISLIAGWSDNIFKFIDARENGSTMLNAIEHYRV